MWEWRHSQESEQRHLTHGRTMNQQIHADDGLPHMRIGAGTCMVEVVLHLYEKMPDGHSSRMGTSLQAGTGF